MRTVVAAALILAWAPGAAWAACKGSNIAGTYQLFAASQATDNVLWTECKIKVRSNGSVQSGTGCEQQDIFGRNRSGPIDGGKLKVKKSCEVTGNVQIIGGKNTISKAWMSRNKDIIEGVGKTENGTDFPVHYGAALAEFDSCVFAGRRERPDLGFWHPPAAGG